MLGLDGTTRTEYSQEHSHAIPMAVHLRSEEPMLLHVHCTHPSPLLCRTNVFGLGRYFTAMHRVIVPNQASIPFLGFEVAGQGSNKNLITATKKYHSITLMMLELPVNEMPIFENTTTLVLCELIEVV